MLAQENKLDSISKMAAILSEKGLSHLWCRAIIWADADLLSFGTLETNLSEILIWNSNIKHLIQKCTSKCRLQNGDRFVWTPCASNQNASRGIGNALVYSGRETPPMVTRLWGRVIM